MSTARLLEVVDLSVEYAGVSSVNKAVNDVTFHVAPGEVVGMVGESGSGKSSAVLAVLGLTRHGGRIVKGTVRFEGKDVLGLPPSELRAIRGARIGLVTQNPRGALNPVVRIGDQIADVYRAHEDARQDAARRRSLELLRMVGINDPERRLQAFPHELSGGMAQRVLIAMALACTPTLLIADEPTSGLDVTVQAQLLDDLRVAADTAGSAILLVTQDLGIVANYCDRLYMMHAGEIVEDAPVGNFFDHPAHPATTALLAAQRGRAVRQFALKGFQIDGRKLPSGCYLHPRCPFADEQTGCTTQRPALREVLPGHEARCHRSDVVQQTAHRLIGDDPQAAADATLSGKAT